ncbi:hypothetical protein CPC08DRAFT_558194 [Agrocybe pediades]|nr:hypothetical protein CPC08DRAFT_558194 [Agrocybe pediades]
MRVFAFMSGLFHLTGLDFRSETSTRTSRLAWPLGQRRQIGFSPTARDSSCHGPRLCNVCPIIGRPLFPFSFSSTSYFFVLLPFAHNAIFHQAETSRGEIFSKPNHARLNRAQLLTHGHHPLVHLSVWTT